MEACFWRLRSLTPCLVSALLTGCSLIVGQGTRELAANEAGVNADPDAGTDARIDPEAGAGPEAQAPDAGNEQDPTDAAVEADSADAAVEADSADARPDVGVDTGGIACAPLCADGFACGANEDCASQQCMGGKCQPPGCAMGMGSCADGTPCGASGDCGSQRCVAGTCAGPACSPMCPPNNACGDDGDCMSHHCKKGQCQ